MKVIKGGMETLTEDWPGRLHWNKSGFATSGVADPISLWIGNLLVGNPRGEVGLELKIGFEAEFTEDTVIAITGADMKPTINNESAPMWESIAVSKSDIIKFEHFPEVGWVSCLTFKDGINVPEFLGSKSTCTKEGYGGFGRKLEAGDELELGTVGKAVIRNLEGRRWRKDLIPKLSEIWEVRATVGPRAAPDYFTEEGMELWFSQPWKVSHNCCRTGIRIENSKPIFTRKDGGLAGIHPSNTQIEPYNTPGALNVSGDYGILLFLDSVSLGGYTCPLAVIRADLWKVGQLVPLRSKIKFVYCALEEAHEALLAQDGMFTEENIE